jgi:hypothetical protein
MTSEWTSATSERQKSFFFFGLFFIFISSYLGLLGGDVRVTVQVVDLIPIGMMY